MRVLLVHNFYQQPGGEDQVFAAEARLLESRGVVVQRLTVHNDRIEHMGRAAVAAATVWSGDGYRQVAEAVRRFRPDVAHFHNTFPLFSPAAYYAAGRGGAAVVQTLHNYRLLCPAAILYRDGHVCEDCVGRAFAWPAVAHRCYRNSAAGSAAIAAMQTSHRALGTWRAAVDQYIALSRFARDKFIAGGLPPARIAIKPNFLDEDPGPGDGAGGYILFVGRLTEEKGILSLLSAWRRENGGGGNGVADGSSSRAGDSPVLRIVGDGPLAGCVREAAASHPAVEYLGRRTPAEVLDLMGHAHALVFPSLWYEGMPRTIVEALARGTPVVASRLGTMAEMICHGHNGLLFSPGDVSDLAACVRQIAGAGCAQVAALRSAARAQYEAHYTADANYRILEGIYRTAIQRRRCTSAVALPA